MAEQGFPKTEKLCSYRLISSLFEKGNSFYVSGYKVVWDKCDLPSDSVYQIAFSVPKRYFKRAVARNLIKRRLREAFRKGKHALYAAIAGNNVSLAIMVIFIGKEIPDYNSIEFSIKEITEALIKRL